MLTNKAEIQQDKQRSDGTYRRIQAGKMQFFYVVGVFWNIFAGVSYGDSGQKNDCFSVTNIAFRRSARQSPVRFAERPGGFPRKVRAFSCKSRHVFPQKHRRLIPSTRLLKGFWRLLSLGTSPGMRKKLSTLSWEKRFPFLFESRFRILASIYKCGGAAGLNWQNADVFLK